MHDGVDVHLIKSQEDVEAKRAALELKQKKAATRAAALARAAEAKAAGEPALTIVLYIPPKE